MKIKQQQISLLISSILGVQAAYALPQGAQVVQGGASFASPNSATLNVTNTNNAVINWQQFNIGAGQTTNFIQPNSASSVLNRVISNNPSQILGNLNSNGQVYLINQFGILVGEGARINTNGFFASTLNITNEDFLNGNLKFSEGGFGGINNKGYIHAGEDGNVVLIAPNIENGGVIEVENGNIILAAGESITIASLDNASIEFHVQAAENTVTNLGSVIAKNGAASLFAGTLKHSGSIRATGLVRDANGIIRLVALDKTEVSGSVDVSGEQAGNIKILGDVVDIQQGANINASGSISAGEILIGGDQQGLNPNVKNAISTTVATGAKVSADGLGEADGGRVIVFASNDVHIQGDISATGGDIAGDGGFIETSGLRQLDITAIPDASATNGEAGEWLIDPNNITIQASASTGISDDGSGGFSTTNDGAILDTSLIVDALDAGTNVTITTGSGGTNLELGDITINDSIVSTAPFIVGDLTLNAFNDINVNADITSASFNALNITLNANSDATGGGSINIENATINTTAANLTLTGDAINIIGDAVIGNQGGTVTLGSQLVINAASSLTLGSGFAAGSILTVQGSPIINNGTLTTNAGCDDGCGIVNFLDNVTNNNSMIFNEGIVHMNSTFDNNAAIQMQIFGDTNELLIGDTDPSVFNINSGSSITGVAGARWIIDTFGTLNVNAALTLPAAMTLSSVGGTFNNFQNLTLPNTFNINGGTLNFNSDITLVDTVTTNIDNIVAPLTLVGSASGAYFTFQGTTNFEASDLNFGIDLTNTSLVNAGDWNVNGVAGQSAIGAGISGANSTFSLTNNSRLIFNSNLSHTISVPVFTEGTIELVNPASNVSFTGAGGLTLENGGRLSGFGTYTGDVIVNRGGQISPGLYGNSRDNTGTLTIDGNVFFNQGSIGIWEIDEIGANFDQLNVTANVAIDNAELFLFWDSLATSTPSFSAPIDLITATGTITSIGGPINDILKDLPAMASGSLAINILTDQVLTYTPGTPGTINYWTGLSLSSAPDWNDAGNWSLGIPVDGNVLVIETGIDVELSVATASLLGDVQLDANLNINANGSLNGSGILNSLQDIRLLTSTSDVSGTGVWNNLLAVFADDDITLSRTTVNNYGGFNWNTPNSTTASFSFTGNDFNNAGTVNFQPLNNANTIDFSGSLNGLTNAGLTVFNIGDIETSFTGTLNNTTSGVLSIVSPNSGAALNMATDNTNNGEISLKDTVFSLNNGVIYQLASTSSLKGAGNYVIGTGSILLADNVTFDTGLAVDLSGGTLGTTTNITINDAFNWTSGTLEGNTTGTLTTGSFATTFLGSNLDTTMNNVNWVNNGFVPWVSSLGDFVIDGSTFTNTGASSSFSVQTTSNLAGITGNAAGVFDNQGSFEINSNTTATSTLIDVKFNHSAIQSVGGLNLGVAGHTLTFQNNIDLTGSAYTNIVSGATLSIANSATLALNSANVELVGTGLLSIESGSTLDIAIAPFSFNTALDLNNGTINTAANFTVSNIFNWNGGTITGSGGSFTADGDSTVNLNALSNLTLDVINMTTAGTTTFSSALSDFILSNDAVWTNTGILNLSNTSTVAEIETFNTTITTPQLINTGTINASPSVNINIVAGFDNQGTVNVTNGILEINDLSTNSGTINVDLGSLFLVGTGSSLTLVGATPSITGAGTFGVANGATFDSAVALTLPESLTTQLNNGSTITNAQNLTLSGILNWNGGTITGTSGGNFTADATSIINLIADLSLTLDTVNMSTAGTTTFSSSLSDFILNNDAVWTNSGTLYLTNTSQLADIQSANSLIAAPQLINTGIINASPTGDNNISLFTQFDNQGAVNVTNGIFDINSPSTSSGTIAISSGATFLVGSSSLTLAGTTPTITGAGLFGVDNGGTFDSAVSLILPNSLTTQLNNGGTIANAQNLTLSGILNWNGGTITGTSGGSFTADVDSTVNLIADNNLTLDTVNMSTAGTTAFSSPLSDFILSSDAVWTNTGTLNLANTSSFADIQTLNSNILTAQLINTGTINASPTGTNANIDIFAQFDNQGTINAISNLIRFNSLTNSGQFNLVSADALVTNLSNTGNVNLASGTTLTADLNLGGGNLSGAGTLVGNLTAGVSSLVSIGDAIGALTVQGDVTFLAGSTFLTRINNANDFDQLLVTGNFASQTGSSLKLTNYTNGYQGNPGDSLDVVTVTGTTINDFSIDNADNLYSGTIDATTGITYNINEVNNTWTGSISSLWNDVDNWSRIETPTLGHAVFINDGITTVEYAETGLSVNSIELTTGNTLSLTAGDLTVINLALLQGNVNIDNAQLTMSAGLTVEDITLSTNATLNVVGDLNAQTLSSNASISNINGDVTVNNFNLVASSLTGNSSDLTSATGGTLSTSTISGFSNVNLTDGTLFVQGGASTLAQASFIHNGIIDIANTASLAIPSTSLTTGASTSFTGSGNLIVGNNAVLDITQGVTFNTALTLTLNGGQINNAENFTIPDVFNWNGGTVSGAAGQIFTIPASATVNITASTGDAILDTVDMLNSGTLNYSGAGLMSIATNFVSSGIFNINSGNVALASTATLSGDTTISLGSVLGFTGNALTNVNILAGANVNGLGVLGSTANVSIANGVDITPRLIVDGGAVSFEGSSTLTALDLNIGTINVDTLGGSSLGDTLTIANLNWTAGTISGDGSANLVTTGVSSLVDGSLENIGWENTGVLNWGGLSTASLALDNASFINAASATLNIVDTDNLVNRQSIGQQGFGNKSIVSNNSLFKNDGTINLINSSLDLNGQTLVLDTSTAVLNGTGTIVGDVINSDGTISMGSAVTAGSIVIDGDYTQGANGTLVVRIVDPINGNFQFDTFAVNGLATLGGTLELVYFSNQVVSITENFNPFTFASRDGIFDTLVDSNGTILGIDISANGLTILGTSSQTTTTIQEVLQNQDKFEEIINVLNDEELDATLAFISDIIRDQKKQKQAKKEGKKKKGPRLVCV